MRNKFKTWSIVNGDVGPIVEAALDMALFTDAEVRDLMHGDAAVWTVRVPNIEATTVYYLANDYWNY